MNTRSIINDPVDAHETGNQNGFNSKEDKSMKDDESDEESDVNLM